MAFISAKFSKFPFSCQLNLYRPLELIGMHSNLYCLNRKSKALPMSAKLSKSHKRWPLLLRKVLLTLVNAIQQVFIILLYSTFKVTCRNIGTGKKADYNIIHRKFWKDHKVRITRIQKIKGLEVNGWLSTSLSEWTLLKS